MQLIQKTKHQRCPYCFDALDGEVCSCGAMHVACVAEHGGCLLCGQSPVPRQRMRGNLCLFCGVRPIHTPLGLLCDACGEERVIEPECQPQHYCPDEAEFRAAPATQTIESGPESQVWLNPTAAAFLRGALPVFLVGLPCLLTVFVEPGFWTVVPLVLLYAWWLVKAQPPSP